MGIADLVLAQHALRLEGSALEAAARMFGLTMESERTTASPSLGFDSEPDDASTSDAGPAVVDVGPRDDGAGSPVRWLEPVAHEPPAQAPTPTVDPLPVKPAGSPPPRHAIRTLLDPLVAADLAMTAASTWSPTTDIDIEAAVRVLSRQLPLTELPRLQQLSLGRGVSVLIDVGESMQPFAKDQAEFLQLLHRTVGGGVRAGYFTDSPLDGVGASRRRFGRRRFEWPPPGQPVVVLSDLGYGTPRRSGASEAWLALAPRLRQRDSAVLALVPVQLRRIPERLQRLMDLVVWDRSTTRAVIAHLRGLPR